MNDCERLINIANNQYFIPNGYLLNFVDIMESGQAIIFSYRIVDKIMYQCDGKDIGICYIVEKADHLDKRRSVYAEAGTAGLPAAMSRLIVHRDQLDKPIRVGVVEGEYRDLINKELSKLQARDKLEDVIDCAAIHEVTHRHQKYLARRMSDEAEEIACRFSAHKNGKAQGWPVAIALRNIAVTAALIASKEGGDNCSEECRFIDAIVRKNISGGNFSDLDFPYDAKTGLNGLMRDLLRGRVAPDVVYDAICSAGRAFNKAFDKDEAGFKARLQDGAQDACALALRHYQIPVVARKPKAPEAVKPPESVKQSPVTKEPKKTISTPKPAAQPAPQPANRQTPPARQQQAGQAVQSANRSPSAAPSQSTISPKPQAGSSGASKPDTRQGGFANLALLSSKRL